MPENISHLDTRWMMTCIGNALDNFEKSQHIAGNTSFNFKLDEFRPDSEKSEPSWRLTLNNPQALIEAFDKVADDAVAIAKLNILSQAAGSIFQL